MQILDVGCGIHKQPGAIGIDRNPASRADVLADLDRFPYPFADSSFDRLTAIHVIEHLNDVIRAMEEFHRLVRADGSVRIETPHYTDFSSFCDPTHKNHLNSFSFRYFGEDHGGFGYYSNVKFREISVRVRLLAFWRWLGFEFLVNRFPRYRRFWEYYLCYVVRGKAMTFEFQVLKLIGLLYRAADALRRRRLQDNHGRMGEDMAHRYLRRRGCTIVARNYRPHSGDGEIDLVAWHGEHLVFVEVKTRSSADFGEPERAVDMEKRQHLERAARDYVRRSGENWPKARFDIVSVVLEYPPRIDWIQDAFPAHRGENE